MQIQSIRIDVKNSDTMPVSNTRFDLRAHPSIPPRNVQVF